MKPVLQIDRLTVSYGHAGGVLLAVRSVSMTVQRGEAYGLVGESGCGKSTAALAMLGYRSANARFVAGSVLVDGEDVVQASPARLGQIRGSGVAMVHQDPVGALNPVMTLGAQLVEVLRAHRPASERAMRDEAVSMLERVALAAPEQFMQRYPHQASGGQLQRVVIAMALLARPKLLVLDEPTTGLDVTVEAEVARLVADLARDFDMAIVYISHNLALISRVCDRIGVMYAGEIVEEGTVAQVFGAPRHPYTMALLECLPRIVGGTLPGRLASIAGRVPRLDKAPSACAFAARCPYVEPGICTDAGAIALSVQPDGRLARCVRIGRFVAVRTQPAPRSDAIQPGPPVLELRSVWKRYQSSAGFWSRLSGRNALAIAPAAADVSFDIARGEVVALVGESGSGKSTLARIVAGLDRTTLGKVHFHAIDIGRLTPRQRPADVVSAIQMVFQNPDRTLNPAHTVARILSRAMRRSGQHDSMPMLQRSRELLDQVGLAASTLTQRPDKLSGGQRQRVAIARALAAAPELLLADEPVSALDVSVQGAIINLLLDVRDRSGAAVLLISHDLALVHAVADRVVVMRRGRVLESGSREAVFSAPYHPYTRALLVAAGSLPAAEQPPIGPDHAAGSGTGCVHAGNCDRFAGSICLTEQPPWRVGAPGHAIACHRQLEELG